MKKNITDENMSRMHSFKSEQKLISIIIPIYNQEKYLNKCLTSIQNQSYSNFEVLLINDGSTDNSGKICDYFSGIDSRFFVFHNKNVGVAAARNIGLDNANGELIGFVDPDDWIEPEMYEYLMSLYNKYFADIISCERLEVFDENTKIQFNSNIIVELTNKEQAIKLLSENDKVKSHLWNRIYKKSLFDGLRFEENRVYEDVWILHQVFDRANNFVFSDKQLYYYRQHPKSIVRDNTLRKQIDHCYAFKCRYEYLSKRYSNNNKAVYICLRYEIINLIDVVSKAKFSDAVKLYSEMKEVFVFYNKINTDNRSVKERLLKFSILITLLLYRMKG